MKPPKVVNVKHEPCEVYIGRGSIWGNPFRIGQDGDRETVIKKYREHILKQPLVLNYLPYLAGKKLGCHCKPLACHGDVLVSLVAKLK